MEKMELKIQALFDYLLSRPKLKFTDQAAETKARVRSAAIGSVLFILLLFVLGGLAAHLLASILGMLMALELSAMIYRLPDQREKRLVLVGSVWLILFLNWLLPHSSKEVLILFFLVWFTYFLATAERYDVRGSSHGVVAVDGMPAFQRHFHELVWSLFALVYAGLLIGYIPIVREGLNGLYWSILFFLVVWVGDTAAYFGGLRYGKTKLYPVISPGKSVEGAVAALLGSLVVGLLFKLLVFKKLTVLGCVSTVVVLSLASQCGDLCESYIKRVFGVKDSSQILPGHGGVLDRFDGVLFAAPFLYICTKIF